MKGDYVDVVLRVPGGTSSVRVQAMTDGASVDVAMPSRNETFVRVEELNKVGKAVRTFRFLATEVISIGEGHSKIERKKKSR